MSSCSEQVRRALRLASWVVLAVVLGTGVAGCSRSRQCSAEELCDGLDNDCDGRVDEDFVDDEGRFVQVDHCGRCGIRCADVFPTASEVECQVKDGEAGCVLTACPEGQHQEGAGACVPDQPSLCLGCEDDDECEALAPSARCLDTGDGNRRCGQACAAGGCPGPFTCTDGQCFPEPSLCACEGVEDDFELACLTSGSAEDLLCAGVRMCGADGLGECVLTVVERCNEADDDCDGDIDEDFRDAEGRYVDRLHCGACGMPCVEPGPNYEATCATDKDTPSCVVACADGYVDVDGIRANGCECLRYDGQSAPIVVGGDLDCDGVPDDDDSFVHVTNAGDDSNPGTILLPMRSIQAALARGQSEGKVVLVARGVYAAFEVVAGVNVFGGYRPDFRDRDIDLYPVFVEASASADGAPALRCEDITQQTAIEGLSLVGQPARTLGQGSTAVLLSGCGPDVALRDLVVLAARGADGEPGPGASNRLPAGIDSLASLDGDDAQGGLLGDGNGQACVPLSGGAGGRHSCGSVDVSGGAGSASSCPDIGCTNGSACPNAGCSDFTVGGVCDLDAVLSRAVANPAAVAGRGSAGGQGGEATYDAPTNRGVCNFCDDNPSLVRVGQQGQDGQPGMSGTGGQGCEDPTLQIDALGRGVAGGGTEGTPGTDGSGGGGGSAGGGFTRIGGTAGECDDNAGGSGGGGGSGGCGAPAGGGGGGGGASVGIVLQTRGVGPTFERVRVITESGGRGGDGGAGAGGGRGGSGAPGGLNSHWCSRAGGRGGDGGDGGGGGGGGGGCGGASHAIVVLGTPDAGYADGLVDALTIERPGASGGGGRGGASPGASGAPGARGNATPILVVSP